MTEGKVLQLTGVQGEWVIGTEPIPSPQPGELLVKVHACGLNPAEWKIRDYNLFPLQFPVVLGGDAAGEVVKVGEGVSGFVVGDRVFFEGDVFKKNGAYKHFTIISADVVAKIPSNISYSQAASLPLAVVTASVALYSAPPQGAALTPAWEEGGVGKYAGQPVVIIGGAAAVSQTAIQLLKLQGFSPIIATASLHNADYLVSLGVAHVIDRKLPLSQLKAEVEAHTKEPIKLVYDGVGYADTQIAGYELLAPGGSLITMQPPTIPAERLKGDRVVLNPWSSVHQPQHRELGIALFRALPQYVEQGIIKPLRFEDLPDGLRGIPDGLDRLRQNKVSGLKLIARPQDTV